MRQTHQSDAGCGEAGAAPPALRIGTAGWTIPKPQATHFPGSGTHLARYAMRLRAAEINTSFHRAHKPAVYARWAASVPEDFRFSVKMPREISHIRKLCDAAGPLERFLGEIAGLGAKLGPLLLQLPPGLAYDEAVAATFLGQLRARHTGAAVCEARHPTWFTDEADCMLQAHRVARVIADPARVEAAKVAGGWPGLIYRRFHGSPRIYYSGYSDAFVVSTAAAMARESAPAGESWCIFDNTAAGEALGDAVRLTASLARACSDQMGSPVRKTCSETDSSSASGAPIGAERALAGKVRDDAKHR